MPVEQVPVLLLSIVAVGYTPGPANIYAMSCALKHGSRQTMNMWLGLLCGFSTAALISAAAAHFAGVAFREFIPFIRYMAVAYILYLAWKTYRTGISDDSDGVPTFMNGFIVQLTNAKMILFDLSCYSLFVLPFSDRLADMLPVAALLLLAGPGANLVWLLAGSALRPFVKAHQKAVSAVMAAALVLSAVAIVLA